MRAQANRAWLLHLKWAISHNLPMVGIIPLHSLKVVCHFYVRSQCHGPKLNQMCMNYKRLFVPTVTERWPWNAKLASRTVANRSRCWQAKTCGTDWPYPSPNCSYPWPSSVNTKAANTSNCYWGRFYRYGSR